MTYDDVKELIDKIQKSDLVSFELSMDNVCVAMSKCGPISRTPEIPTVVSAPMVTTPVVSAPKETPSLAVAETVEEKATQTSGNLVKSPIVGTFYSSTGPDKPPLATKGGKVKKGDILCIVEAMKIMNEIVSEYEGEIGEILVENGQLVEYGQPLFRIV